MHRYLRERRPIKALNVMELMLQRGRRPTLAIITRVAIELSKHKMDSSERCRNVVRVRHSSFFVLFSLLLLARLDLDLDLVLLVLLVLLLYICTIN